MPKIIVIFAALAALSGAPAGAAGVPAETTLPACYPGAAVEAVFTQKSPELAASLEAALPDMKKSGAGGPMVLADYYLLAAHTYAQVPGKTAEAAKYYRLAAEALASADFLPVGLDPVALEKQNEAREKAKMDQLWIAKDKEKKEKDRTEAFSGWMDVSARHKANTEGLPKLEAAIARMRLWAKLRRAWAYYGELGLAGGDAEAQKKGEELLAALGDPGLAEKRAWLVPAASGPKQAGAAQVTLEPWHPMRTDRQYLYELPFLYKTQTFLLTVRNGGTAPVEFTSDDIQLAGKDGSAAALSVGELTPDVLGNGLDMQQFFFPELTPYTFSWLSTKEFNELQLEANPKLADQQWKADQLAQFNAMMARIARERAERAMGWANATRGTVNGILNGIDAASARQDAQRASEARMSGNYRTAALYENRSRWASDNIRSRDEEQKTWEASARRTVENAGKVETMEGFEPKIDPAAWSNSASDNFTRLEAKITLRLAAKKLERFLNSDFVLPHKGTALRIPPGQSWAALVSFPASASADTARVAVDNGGVKKTVAFPLQAREAWVVKAPWLQYKAPLQIMKSHEYGDTMVMKAVDWKVILPDLVYQ